MPKLPAYQDQARVGGVPSFRARDVSVRADVSSGVQAVGQAIGQAAQGIGRIVEERKQAQDKQDTIIAQQALSGAQLDAMKWTAETLPGFQGIEARNAPAAADQWLKERYKTAKEGLTPEQIAKFNGFWHVIPESVMGHALNHERVQVDAAQQAANVATTQNFVDLAKLAVDDTEMDKQLQGAYAGIDQQLKGQAPEVVALAKRKAKGDVLSSRFISGLGTFDTTQSDEMVDAVERHMGERLSQIGEDIGEDKRQALSKALDMVAKNRKVAIKADRVEAGKKQLQAVENTVYDVTGKALAKKMSWIDATQAGIAAIEAAGSGVVDEKQRFAYLNFIQTAQHGQIADKAGLEVAREKAENQRVDDLFNGLGIALMQRDIEANKADESLNDILKRENGKVKYTQFKMIKELITKRRDTDDMDAELKQMNVNIAKTMQEKWATTHGHVPKAPGEKREKAIDKLLKFNPPDAPYLLQIASMQDDLNKVAKSAKDKQEISNYYNSIMAKPRDDVLLDKAQKAYFPLIVPQ